MATSSVPMELALATQFVQLLPEPAFLLAADGAIAFSNSAAADLLGVPRLDLQGAAFGSLVDGPPERIAEYLRHCARSRQLVPGAFRWATHDRGVIDMRCDGAVLVPRTGSRPAMLFLRCRPRDEASQHFVLLNRKIAELSREIVERRKAEQQRDELLRAEHAARVEAEQASRMKDEFLATLSHELRTPLNAVLGWTHVLQRAGLAPPQAAEALSAIERNARAQARIVEDLLDMSRIISGNVRLDVQRVALGPLVEAALDAVRPAADAKGIRLQSVLDPLAAAVRGDPARLQQVAWNLLSNAVKFTPKGGRVQVLLERVNSHLEITVSDTGEGIRPDFLPRVFDRFTQGDGSSTRRHQGLGLGLAIVKHLVELHGGSVRAKSAGEGQGATFIVTLPVPLTHDADDAAPVHPGVDHQAVAPDDAMRLDGARVLVVDDEADARELMRHLLSARGAQVALAASAAEALAMLEREAPMHLIVCDIGMPETDGYAFIAEARARLAGSGGSRIPAVAVTAFARSADRTRAMQAGFNAHLAKPVEPAELISTLVSLRRLADG